ncbi:MAG: hypothetical protein M1813_002791 [Trichoglossum hirsutum]|jgi:hypothetical protein|nr:MAG: hypothetical protein M1813_002791 [Trichoglossum hirsutum]
MRFTSVLLSISVMAMASSATFTIPSDAPDGLSFGIVDNGGNVTFVAEAQLTPALRLLVKGTNSTNTTNSMNTTAANKKRGSSSPVANCDKFAVDPDDLREGAWAFSDWFGCGQTIKDTGAHIAATFKYGGVVLYACNYGGAQTVTGSSLLSYLNLVDTSCGLNAGWWSSSTSKATFGYTQPNIAFC